MGVFICFEYLNQQSCESVISFERTTKALVNLFAGPFVHTEMLVATPTETSMLTIHLGGVFCKAPYDPAVHKNFTFLSLSISPDEELNPVRRVSPVRSSTTPRTCSCTRCRLETRVSGA